MNLKKEKSLANNRTGSINKRALEVNKRLKLGFGEEKKKSFGLGLSPKRKKDQGKTPYQQILEAGSIRTSSPGNVNSGGVSSHIPSITFGVRSTQKSKSKRSDSIS